jgi:putative transcriptional regulator
MTLWPARSGHSGAHHGHSVLGSHGWIVLRIVRSRQLRSFFSYLSKALASMSVSSYSQLRGNTSMLFACSRDQSKRGRPMKREIFSELMDGLRDLAAAREGKITLKTHTLNLPKRIPITSGETEIRPKLKSRTPTKPA